MSPELDELLCKVAPNLFVDRHAPMDRTCLCWGFPGDGWFLIIYTTAKKLEQMILALPEDQRVHCKASQLKEKFGSMRWYMDGATDEMYELVSKAEEASCTVCEDCGLPGTFRKGGWVVVQCDGCWEQTKKLRAEREAKYALTPAEESAVDKIARELDENE